MTDERHALPYEKIVSIVQAGACWIEVADIGDEEQEATITFRQDGQEFENPIPVGWVQKLYDAGWLMDDGYMENGVHFFSPAPF